MVHLEIEGQLVVTAAQVLDERMSSADAMEVKQLTAAFRVGM
jgi:hypothetical protein